MSISCLSHLYSYFKKIYFSCFSKKDFFLVLVWWLWTIAYFQTTQKLISLNITLLFPLQKRNRGRTACATKTSLSMVLTGEGGEAIIQYHTDNDKMSAAVLFQNGGNIFLSPTRVQFPTSTFHSQVSPSLHLTGTSTLGGWLWSQRCWPTLGRVWQLIPGTSSFQKYRQSSGGSHQLPLEGRSYGNIKTTCNHPFTLCFCWATWLSTHSKSQFSINVFTGRLKCRSCQSFLMNW